MPLGGWLGVGKSAKGHGHAKSLDALSELAQLQDAMSAITHIMNDDIDSAEAQLAKSSSSFHQLGVGVCTFLRATLGFEQEAMREASNTLYTAECTAYDQQKRASKDTNAYRSPIYPPGTEYAVCQAEAQLMGAVVGVLNESLTEALKSFYKLRKAYIALQAVMDAEKQFLSKQSTNSVNSTGAGRLSKPGSIRSNVGGSTLKSSGPPTSLSGSTASLKRSQHGDKPKADDDDDEDFDFVDAQEDFEKLTLDAQGNPEADISTFSDHPLDMFILSGSNFCFGMLLLILSFIPPSFASLLKIVGFKGDRERGMQMLWQATKFHDIHGAMAGIVLMGYLNGFTSFCDILPSTGEGSYPKARCVALLGSMRERYPNSHLWLFEEARMLAAEKELERSVKFIEDAGESKLKQLEALGWFERSLNHMYMHDYEATSFAFEKCILLNNWSHGLYYFICGASHVELYRQSKGTDPGAAAKYAARAEDFFKKVIPNTGKKKFMARQLPFDVFVIRKIQKWEARAKEWNCNLIDAIGVSPLEEMIYFWNGYKRMRTDHLEVSLKNLAWSESTANPHWEKEGLDEKAILVVLRAATLRNMDQTTQAKALLESEVLVHDRALFKGNLKDNWTAPCARYEMAANLWREADANGSPESHPKLLVQCKDWLEEVSKWEAFDLDARIGMKITTGKDTLRKYGILL
ncbi:hypothetical protein P153DRAFT_312114 [Dothidotthia symphoricarpi CBS 119687]|uniref:Inclusion body clearance protein IML2 n=1 Tax=Dothidotthia symphoricarpi CBS 119687 TaxID=1392245 RepID=A0A6A6AIG4_9PLEO|nr:uncharacterized protein P153DRAFT_312114 [Dothidotthia symphoricarpi CBS 119687]KAF2131600.1 hypothetical protein P153DRAFT_312114 [Dothidotthia symphoricarpi CBS 119687]